MNTNKGIGRVRLRLAAMLSVELGKFVPPEDITPRLGAWRTRVGLDVCRWEGRLPWPGYKEGAPVMCWDTMSECVRFGVGVERDSSGGLDAFALDPRKPSDVIKAAEQKRHAKEYMQ